MPRQQLTDVRRATILIELAKKVPIKDVAQEFQVHRRIMRCRDTFRNENRLKRRVYNGSKAFEEFQELKLYVTDNPFATLEQMKAHLNIGLTVSCISKYLEIHVLSSRVSPKKFLVDGVNPQLRLATIADRRGWFEEIASSVAF